MKMHSLSKKDNSIPKDKIGGKCRPFIKMSENKISVPKSFAIESGFFMNHINKIGLRYEIELLYISKDSNDLSKTLAKIRRKIEDEDIEDVLKKEILKLKNIGINKWAVRSSANIEDDSIKSWAGGFESFIGVKHKNIENYIKKVWASVFSERVINYLEKPENIKNIKMAVLIQEAIDADVSGVCFTTNISEEDSKEIVIEAVHGIGEYLVQGQVIPDRYVVEKDSHIVLEVHFNEQKYKLKFSKGILNKVNNKNFKKQKLTGKQIVTLSKVVEKVEKVFKEPQDVEWCVKRNNIYILQSRPITFKVT